MGMFFALSTLLDYVDNWNTSRGRYFSHLLTVMIGIERDMDEYKMDDYHRSSARSTDHAQWGTVSEYPEVAAAIEGFC